MIVRRTSIFPAQRQEVFSLLQRLETLQYVAAPYATFSPVEGQKDTMWQIGSTTSYRFRLLGFIPFGTHTIRIERFDMDIVQSREHNEHIRVWDHKITLRDMGTQTEYIDEVEIHAGWKTPFIWLWAQAFYAHRQRKWIRLLGV